jgi:hypothetical protein
VTAVAQRHAIGAVVGTIGGTLAVLAGVVQVLVGSRIPAWSGAKNDPLVLGLVTVVFGAIALVGARSLRGEGHGSPGRRAASAAAVLVPAGLILTTVGRLGYLPCALLVIAAACAVGDVREVGHVVARHWRPVLRSVLGGVQVLMAASAAPVLTAVVGVAGGLLAGVAAWVPRRALRIALVVVGTVPFAALTWWGVVPALLAAAAVGIAVLRPVRDPW